MFFFVRGNMMAHRKIPVGQKTADLATHVHQVATFHISNAAQSMLRFQFPETLPAPLEGVQNLGTFAWCWMDLGFSEMNGNFWKFFLGIKMLILKSDTNFLEIVRVKTVAKRQKI